MFSLVRFWLASVGYGVTGLWLLMGLSTYSVHDPSWNHLPASSLSPIVNLCGSWGAIASDLLFQTFGSLAWLIPVLLLCAGFPKKNLTPPLSWMIHAFLACSFGTLLEDKPEINLMGYVMLQITQGLFLDYPSFVRVGVIAASFLFFSITSVWPFYFCWMRRGFSFLRSWQVKIKQAPFKSSPGNHPLSQKANKIEQEKHSFISSIRSFWPWSCWTLFTRLRAACVRFLWQPPRSFHGVDAYTHLQRAPRFSAPHPMPERRALLETIQQEDVFLSQPSIETKPEPSLDKQSFSGKRTYHLPSSELLRPVQQSMDLEAFLKELEAGKSRLNTVLQEFGIRGNLHSVRPGPVVSLYEFEPASGVKASRIINLAEDIARSMHAVSARISIVSGKNLVGIEIPNQQRETVSFRDLLESDAFHNPEYLLPMILGQDISGHPIIADLARMPHVLIAGTTGSGKSVCINAFLLSLLYRHTPETCRLLLIDPKILELSVYQGLPHLVRPVVTDPEQAIEALQWVLQEMEERYRQMATVGVRNLKSYNTLVEEQSVDGFFIKEIPSGFDAAGKPQSETIHIPVQKLPYLVIVVDEMADLMLTAGKEIEKAVQRIAQMARAAGIHMVMATQRPSVDVITGTIKANFPTRISFQLISRFDSRTILGEQGAESLLGQGDMLYMPAGPIMRVHGAYVSDQDVQAVTSFWHKQTFF